RRAPPLGGALPPHDHFPAVGLLEDGLDGRGVLPGPDQIRAGASADEEPDGAHEDRFAGAGLARQYIQAGLELQLELVDDRQVMDAEEPDHPRSSILSDV